MMQQGTYFRNVRVLTMDAADTEWVATNVRVAGQTIVAIGHDVQSELNDRIVDGTGKLLMPGLINGHFHSPGSFNKGALDDMPLELFMLYEVPPFDCPSTSPRMHYLRTLLGAMEMLKGGVTAVHDDPFYVPALTEELTNATMQAYADAGIRATVSINMPNVIEYGKYPFLYELLPEEFRERMKAAKAASADELLNSYRRFIAAWHGAESGRLRCSVSCSAPQRVTKEYLHGLSGLSAEHDLPYNMHILETRLQRVLGDELLEGRSLVRYVEDEGVLNERSLVIHAIWIDEQDMDILASSGCSIAHNPLCNLKLGSGIMPFRHLARRGINICLGSDEMCSDDAVNLWNVAKLGGLVHKITDPDYRQWPKANELLKCATRNGAAAMRQGDVTGSIEVGKQADLILIDLQTLNFTPLNDLRRQLIFCENGSSVRLVMVAGTSVVEGGELLTVNEENIKDEIRDLWPEYLEQLQQVDHWARIIEPIYRQMYEISLKRKVPMQRSLHYVESASQAVDNFTAV
jgi:5-methylthioadenosine/S-adenosylhomocysteine deaminase